MQNRHKLTNRNELGCCCVHYFLYLFILQQTMSQYSMILRFSYLQLYAPKKSHLFTLRHTTFPEESQFSLQVTPIYFIKGGTFDFVRLRDEVDQILFKIMGSLFVKVFHFFLCHSVLQETSKNMFRWKWDLLSKIANSKFHELVKIFKVTISS
eukprot:m.137306 g.137306  ORF g.137306 m.137306 type:complete len:153 (-) comp11535_c0_seq1:2508-2966(-)